MIRSGGGAQRLFRVRFKNMSSLYNLRLVFAVDFYPIIPGDFGKTYGIRANAVSS